MPRPRRKQRLTLAVLVALSLTLFTLDYRMSDRSGLAALRSGVATVVGPLQEAVVATTDPVTRAGPRISELASAEDTVRRLRRENEELRQRLQASALDRSTADQLHALQLLSGSGGYRVVPGRVVGFGSNAGLEWTATVDLGTHDGVRDGMTVMNGDGLVGRVKRTTAHTSVVLLAIDPLSAVGSRLEGSRQLGLCKGAGLRPLHFQLLDPDGEIRLGDGIVTGPYGQTTYAAGVPVGTVAALTQAPGSVVRAAEVRPYVDFTALDLVGVVIAAPRGDPRDALLTAKRSTRTG